MTTCIGTERETTTRLHVGDVVDLDGREWGVELVNESRAVIRCLADTKRTVTPRFGKPFEVRTREQLSISPNSEVKILRRSNGQQQ